MLRFIKRVFVFFALFILYLVLKEILQLYAVLKAVHPWAAVGFALLIGAAILYSLIYPAVRLLFMPVYPGPVNNEKDVPRLIEKRVRLFEVNPYMKTQQLETPHSDLPVLYEHQVKILKSECHRIRKKYILQMFYSTSIAQNRFLDAMLVLGISFNLVKEIMILYHGRLVMRDLWTIGRKIFLAVILAGSEGVEIAAEEVVRKLAADPLRNIPYLDKIVGSIADGYVNATLMARISYICENYCTMTLIRSGRDLNPSLDFIAATVRTVTGQIIEHFGKALRKVTINKAADMVLFARNPVRELIVRSDDKTLTSAIKDVSLLPFNLIGQGFSRIINTMRRKD